MAGEGAPPVVVVRDLWFRYRAGGADVLRGASLEVPHAARCAIVGANGAGKTTLLRVIGGKHLVPAESVRVLGRAAFHDTELAGEVEYLGGNFPFAVDVRVGDVVDPVLRAHPQRCGRLMALLGVERDWHMHRVSDGQRRRVQLLLGLGRPRSLLLLDEVTTDLDLVARQELLDFLREESEVRGVTILYASHILDRLDAWITHVCFMGSGRVERMAERGAIPELARAGAAGAGQAALYDVVLAWLRRTDREIV